MKIRHTAIIVILLLLLPTIAFAQDGGASEEIVDLSNDVAVVSVDRANLRGGPGLDQPVVGQVGLGTRLPIINRTVASSETWYQVELRNSQTPWISSSVTAITQIPDSAALAPAESALYISVDTSPGMFDRVDNLFTIFSGGTSNPFIGDELNKLMFLLFLNDDINLDVVRPWLGDEVTIVNLQCLSSRMSDYLVESVENNTPNPEVVIMAQILDMNGAERFIDQVFDGGTLGDGPVELVEYEGYEYRILTDVREETNLPVVAMGIVDDYLVFTQGGQDFETIIDVANGEIDPLDEEEGFERVYGNLDRESFLRVYAGPSLFCPVHDSILYNALLNDSFADGGFSIPEAEVDSDENLQDLLTTLQDEVFQGYGMGFIEDGEDDIVLDLVTDFDDERLQELTNLPDDEIDNLNQTMGMELFGFLTPATLELLAFGGAQNIYRDLAQISAQTPGDMFESATGFDSDVLNWIDGSITMGFLDYPLFFNSEETEEDAFFLMVIESSDEAKAQASREAIIDRVGAEATFSDISGFEVARMGTETVEVVTVGTVTIIVTGGNMDRVLDAALQPDGTILNDWRQFASIAGEGAAPDEIFTTGLDLTAFSSESVLQAYAIVAPAVDGIGPSRITIICKIGRGGGFSPVADRN